MPTFEATLIQERKTATGIEVPAEVVAALGGGKRPAVTVALNGYTYRSTVGVMGGRSLIPVSAEHRTAAGLTAGDRVTVTLEPDTAPREVTVPDDLGAALDGNAAAREAFARLSPSAKKAHVQSLEAAKTPETRARRLAKVLEVLG